jgi:hypothetical protein
LPHVEDHGYKKKEDQNKKEDDSKCDIKDEQENDHVLCCCKHYYHHDESIKFQLRLADKKTADLRLFKEKKQGKVIEILKAKEQTNIKYLTTYD